MFIAHLVNQVVAHELIALQILVLLLEKPTDDSVELAVAFMREAGAYLSENSPKAAAGVFERFRAVLHEGSIDKRVQYMIEVLMQVRKDKFKDNPIVPEGLDLVEEEDQITHRVSLDDELQVQEGLSMYHALVVHCNGGLRVSTDLFKADPKFLENEERYKEIRAEILGEGSDEESGSGSEEDEDDEEEAAVADKAGIEDRTEQNLINLRRTIYLTIVNTVRIAHIYHAAILTYTSAELRGSRAQAYEGQPPRRPGNRALQDGYRVLLASPLVRQILRPHWRALLQARARLVRLL